MAYLDNTRANYGRACELTLCLTAAEVKLLMPHFIKALKNSEAKYQKYKDIQDGGEATTAQQNALVKYEEEVAALESAIRAAKELID